ncbi:hypothetical protein ASPZODRAFT_16269 [Penicilliopsis zonata CBS 506.65]|uniref:Uncharacterized protein n=1 Tax=Penicilliopsis zonata CBS 506.65 TaxID=1073090 RepID=A0A1L9SH41_9EURO|nr:hypothetical protein ASPZODRAFT_16269 [Penicilliopsis zonata CBS 506.65]OJJ46509.1 hypothetical protein ASPZODRAFT_16269 [Penicilliopsis zonata CBS 506.65]
MPAKRPSPAQKEDAKKAAKRQSTDLEKLNSGSKITKEELLLLRVLWDTSEPVESLERALEPYLTQARALLGQNAEFLAFLQGLQAVAAGVPANLIGMGAFMVPFKQMENVLRVSGLKETKPNANEARLRDSVNEEEVNVAAISLLTAIEPAVSMQESAEMATYTPVYREYMLGQRATLSPTDFTTMHRYGCWSMERSEEAQRFVELVLAIILRAREEES